MSDKIVYFTTRHTTVRRKNGNGDGPRKPSKGVIDVFQAEGMTGLDCCVPADIAARMLLVAEKAGVKIR